MGNNGLRWYSLIKLAGHTSSTRDKRKNGVIRVAILSQHMKQKMALKEKWRYPEWQKERVPDGDTLCCCRCGANRVADIRSQR